jgi:ATP-binding cassette subfamily F protein uup
MDKVVDHLLVFHGNADVQDFPGNYTDYREYKELKLQQERQEKEQKEREQKEKEQRTAQAQPNSSAPATTNAAGHARKLTFKEKTELDKLTAEIDKLESEKKEIETALSGATLSSDKIVELSKRIAAVNDELDEKSMRWLELSEIAEG